MMGYWKYWLFGQHTGESNSEQEGFGSLREFIYLDELSVRSLLASTGEGGIPVETSNKSLKEKTRQFGGGISADAGVASGNVRANGQNRQQSANETVSSLESGQSRFTQLYQSNAVKKRVSLGNLKKSREINDLGEVYLSDFERGDVLELRVDLQANLLFRLYRAIEYFYDVAPEQFDPDTKQMLTLIRESIGGSIPVIGTATNYELVSEDTRSLQPLQESETPSPDSEVLLVAQLELENLRADPIDTLFDDEEFVMYCRITSVDVGTWYPLKITQVLNSLPGNAAEQLNSLMENGLSEARTELVDIDLQNGETGTTNPTVHSALVYHYASLLETETGESVNDSLTDSIVNQVFESVNVDDYESGREAKKALLETYTDVFIDQTDLDEVDSGTRLELRNQAIDALEDSKVQVDDDQKNIEPVFEVKPVAIYW
ncbi:hypothetical protein [Haloarchaeobius sp. HME9146]|uniref:DUF6414 family protein n=1 Tax=Haloarchaeobius sp. HME9146 TaxID=2978732 RepID=UPI0021C0BE50|nr:hypothetical protein [Haloarchaeobius sp. HME9146]MCT9096970.1 hypothetical protein [Haloarchaeobius sp. HME9146]